MSASLASIFSTFQHPDYTIQYEPLGKGATSAIFPVTCLKRLSGKAKYVIKLYHKPQDKEREVNMLKHINDTLTQVASQNPSKNALFEQFIGLDAHGDFPSPFAILEKCHVNLKQHFKENVNDNEVLLELKKVLTAHIFPAILFLHENNIVHGDIKAENIMFGSKHWKLIDFGCASFAGYDAAGGSYIPPEHKRAFEMNLQPKSSVKVDSFALGVTILDIVCRDAEPYWDFIEASPNYSNFSIALPPPTNLIGGRVFYDKLAELLFKDPEERKTVRKFSSNSFFKDVVVTKDFQNAQFTEIIQWQNSIIKNQQDMMRKLDNILANVVEFLPAIQDNLISMMATSELPNRFVIVPVKGDFDRFTKSFYTKCKLHFICDFGGHIAKPSESDGYSIMQVTALGKSVLMISKILLVAAIKQLAGADLGAEINKVLSFGHQAISSLRTPNFEGNDMLSGLDAGGDWDSLTASFNEVSKLVEDMSTSDLESFHNAKTEDDWIRIFAPLKPVIKEFLQGKDLSKMGVQLGRQKNGKAVWVCKDHYRRFSNAMAPFEFNNTSSQPQFAIHPSHTGVVMPLTGESDIRLRRSEVKSPFVSIEMAPSKSAAVLEGASGNEAVHTFFDKYRYRIIAGIGILIIGVVVIVVILFVLLVLPSTSKSSTSSAGSQLNVNNLALSTTPSTGSHLSNQYNRHYSKHHSHIRGIDSNNCH